jgi:hypothetical protein
MNKLWKLFILIKHKKKLIYENIQENINSDQKETVINDANILIQNCTVL